MSESARRPSRTPTLEDAIEVWQIWLTSHEFQNRIAARFDFNPGRVNDILKGRLYPEARKIAESRLNGDNDNSPPLDHGGQFTLL